LIADYGEEVVDLYQYQILGVDEVVKEYSQAIDIMISFKLDRLGIPSMISAESIISSDTALPIQHKFTTEFQDLQIPNQLEANEIQEILQQLEFYADIELRKEQAE